jgi:hypothetical protein
LQPVRNVKSYYFRDLKRYGRGCKPRPAQIFQFKNQLVVLNLMALSPKVDIRNQNITILSYYSQCHIVPEKPHECRVDYAPLIPMPYRGGQNEWSGADFVP